MPQVSPLDAVQTGEGVITLILVVKSALLAGFLLWMARRIYQARKDD